MKIKIFYFFLFALLQANAQNRVDVEVGPIYKELITELDDCISDKDRNCLEIANNIIEKGKREKVVFLDYLYFKKAFYFWNRNELDSVIVYSKLVIENQHPVEKERSDTAAYNLLANSYYYKGELDTAIQYYLKVAEVLEEGGNQLHLGYLYSNIAQVFGQTNNHDKQLEYLLKSFKLLEENDDKRFIATVASNLGLNYLDKKDTLQSVKWSEKALKLSDLSYDLIAKTQSLLNLSIIEKDLTTSLKYAEQSVQYADELKDKTHQATAYYNYANVLNNTGNNQKALLFAEKAVSISEEIGDNSTLVNASYAAANIYYSIGQKEKSADYYRIYAAHKDAFSSVENARVINEISTKYETERKEKQIAEQELKIQKQQSNFLYAILGGLLLVSVFSGIFIHNKKAHKLKLKNLQQEKENAILNSFILGEERERARISHELHDGVAAMIGAAKMSLESIPHLPTDKKIEQLAKVERILERSHADIRHIAHNLLPTVLEKEGLIQATKHFVSEINDTKLVNISVTDNLSQAETYPKQLQLMLFRVIQELVNNIIKHSKAQNAEIIFSKSQNVLQIEVIDDGIGYDLNKNQENQGLYSITQRIKSIGGNFNISKISKGGTKAKLNLNL